MPDGQHFALALLNAECVHVPAGVFVAGHLLRHEPLRPLSVWISVPRGGNCVGGGPGCAHSQRHHTAHARAAAASNGRQFGGVVCQHPRLYCCHEEHAAGEPGGHPYLHSPGVPRLLLRPVRRVGSVRDQGDCGCASWVGWEVRFQRLEPQGGHTVRIRGGHPQYVCAHYQHRSGVCYGHKGRNRLHQHHPIGGRRVPDRSARQHAAACDRDRHFCRPGLSTAPPGVREAKAAAADV